jgi:hypothetical protein
LRYWPLLVVLAVRLWAFVTYPIAAEDAYITFHAANDPSWMKATTSPLWATFLSIGNPEVVARYVTLAADLLACGVALSMFTVAGGLAFCAFWCTPFMVGSSAAGIETHLIACAMVCALRWPLGFAFAGLRPDACVVSLVAAVKRRGWALAGAFVMVVGNLAVAGAALPQTIGSKASTYGVHWFEGWYWWHSSGLGWLELALIAGACLAVWRTRRWWYLAAALGPIALHWTLGTPNFWWYAVTPAAMLAALCCERMNRVGAVVAVVACAVVFSAQSYALSERTRQEKTMWEAGEELRRLNPSGTVFLEPLGIIPYLNPNLNVVDEIGLMTPRVAERRSQGAGWMADVLAEYRPEWVVVRTRFLRNPRLQFTGAGSPFRSDAEVYKTLDHPRYGYWIMAISTTDGSRVRYQSCDMTILKRKNMVALPPDFKTPEIWLVKT